MKKKSRFILIGSAIVLIIAVMITATIGYLIFHVDYGNDTILFYENNGCKIYVDEETKAKLSNDTYFEQTRKEIEFDPQMNETIAFGIALKFFVDPILNKPNSDPSRYWYDDDSGPGRIIIEDMFDYDVYFNESNSLSKEKLSDEELTGIAEDLIMKYRGDISDLRVDHISGSKMSRGSTKTGKETFMGYGNYIVGFAQYIDGIKVTGERGMIKIGTDPFGNPNYYKDNTIADFNITDRKSNIKKPTEILKEFTENKGGEFDYTLEDIDLVFNLNSDNAYLEYQLEVKARTKYYQPQTLFFYA